MRALLSLSLLVTAADAGPLLSGPDSYPIRLSAQHWLSRDGGVPSLSVRQRNVEVLRVSENYSRFEFREGCQVADAGTLLVLCPPRKP